MEVVATGFGDPSVLKIVPTDEVAPTPGEVAIEVRAAGVNHVDYTRYADPAGANNTAIVEFLVEDAEALYTTLKTEFDDLDVVQAPTVMPWGNVSVLIRDPEGSLINLYTPVTPDGIKLQQNRTPQMLPEST